MSFWILSFDFHFLNSFLPNLFVRQFRCIVKLCKSAATLQLIKAILSTLALLSLSLSLPFDIAFYSSSTVMFLLNTLSTRLRFDAVRSKKRGRIFERRSHLKQHNYLIDLRRPSKKHRVKKKPREDEEIFVELSVFWGKVEMSNMCIWILCFSFL